MEDNFPGRENSELLRMTSEVVAAYVGNNHIATEDLPNLIGDVFRSISQLSSEDEATEPAEPQKPAVPVRRSITPDYLICLEDGKKLKMLKRYLRSRYNMTPEEYRAKWKLASDYPMVAPNYAKQRSDFAMKIGLGKRGKK